ncbi:MAG: hypothetical protein M3R17_09225 [Bacteroidota bacterium]|nr:hypothetical protein [Bacteroidota bacterium]
MNIVRNFWLLLLLFFSKQIIAQTQSFLPPDHSSTVLLVYHIRNDTTLETVILENEEFTGHTTDAGASLTGYYKNGKLVRIKSWIGLSNGIKTEDFIYKNGKLIYVEKETERFLTDSLGNIDHSQTEKMISGMYYFEKGEFQSSQGEIRDETNSESYDPSHLLQKAKEYSEMLRKKKAKK